MREKDRLAWVHPVRCSDCARGRVPRSYELMLLHDTSAAETSPDLSCRTCGQPYRWGSSAVMRELV